MKRYYSSWITLIILVNIIELQIQLKFKNVSKIFDEYVKEARKYPYNDFHNMEIKKKSNTDSMAKMILIKVEDISAMCPFNAKCIHKSFVAFKLLRKYTNLPVNLVIGISNFPFQAHAWIKYKEFNLVDDYLETDKYKVILDSNQYRG